MSLDPDGRWLRLLRAAPAALACILFATLAWALLSIPKDSGLGPQVRMRLWESGVENPVTAVLLNFRSYDTLLEIVVLLLAALCVGTFSDAEREPAALSAGPVLLAFVRSVIPVMVTVAAYLLWAGASRPGGAFQAGAVLAGAGVLLLLADGAAHPVMKVWLSPPPLAIGVLAFILAAVSGAAAGGRLLEYPRELAGVLIVIVEAAAALSIGAILTVLFARTTVLRREQPPQFEEIAGDRAEE